MEQSHIRVNRDGAVLRLTLCRPRRHNAFSDQTIAELDQALDQADPATGIRALVLDAQGASFSAGADLDWMRRMAGAGDEQNLADSQRLARLLLRLDQLPVPTLALVQGPAYGGGVGLVACCDIALAAEDAQFALTEVRLGLVPAVIGPHVVGAIGARAARRLFLTAERFDAAEALRLGLVHEICPAASLADRGAQILAQLLANGPAALAAAKALIPAIAGRTRDLAQADAMAALIARLRAGPEGREGITAFLEGRPAQWPG